MSLTIVSVPESGAKAQRMNIIKQHFAIKFKTTPDFYVRAPGRVNIIGEHIDYCGYAVFPMAITQDIIIGVSEREDHKICITNVGEKYENFECDIDNFAIEDIKPNWYKYVLCGIQGIKDEGMLTQPLKGLSLVISGNIPPSAGLSSSSALVCAAALVLTHCFKGTLSLHALAELCARAERYIGTEGGGMDQAASLLSNAGFAQLMQFNPLRCTPVSLPRGAVFVVANSLADKSKAEGSEFNTRVIECRLACRLIAKKMSVPLKRNIQLGELQNMLGNSFSEMVELVKKYLHPQSYSKQELCQLLNMSDAQLEKEVLSANTKHLIEFDLQKRALHVFTEASRVWEFKHISEEWTRRCARAGEEEKIKVLQQLGKLMEESHASAQLLYECSHPQLDKIVKLSKGIAYGARLTGAGWGGCVIALVDKDKADEYQDVIKKKYYEAEELTVTDWSSVLFSTEPSSGACIYSSSVSDSA